MSLRDVSIPTINRIKRRYREGGIDLAIFEGKRSGRPRKVGPKERAEIIARACSAPPGEHSRWTAELLAKHVKTKERLSASTIKLVLREDGIKPWREKNVVRSHANSRISSLHVRRVENL